MMLCMMGEELPLPVGPVRRVVVAPSPVVRPVDGAGKAIGPVRCPLATRLRKFRGRAPQQGILQVMLLVRRIPSSPHPWPLWRQGAGGIQTLSRPECLTDELFTRSSERALPPRLLAPLGGVDPR